MQRHLASALVAVTLAALATQSATAAPEKGGSS